MSAENKPATGFSARLQGAFDRYGRLAIITWFALWIATIAGFAVAISAGLDVDAAVRGLLDAVGLDPSAWSGGGGEAGVLALAYLAAQATKPLRIGLYFLILPVVARLFGPKTAPPA